MSKPFFRPITAPLDVDDVALGRLADQMGVPVLVKPTTPAPPSPALETREDATKPKPASTPSADEPLSPRSKKPAVATVATRAALEKLTFELPGYLIDAVKRDAIDRHTTARHVMMLALQVAGFKIEAADLVPDARRTRRKTGNP